ncbi:unnamed protein product [Mesocestoides corti]|uniref:Uncharacterized protein n=1 Tax=Mesocestoides corti TaxID=53468 RepID=A0A3P6HD00_MESCO|nr:unnamed protein product [Mesocestoides corti]
MTDTNSEEGSNLPEVPAFLTYRDAHRGFPPLFRDASNNRREADPPTQASDSNGVGRFFGFADSAAAFLQEVLQHRNSPSLLEQTGDVRAVGRPPRIRGFRQFHSTWEGRRLVSAVAASQFQDGGVSIPHAPPSRARLTVVYAVVLAHSRDLGG